MEVKNMIKVLEDDGHNAPSWHIFRDLAQAAGYIGCEIQELEDSFEFQDDNCVTWRVLDKLYVGDHREEE